MTVNSIWPIFKEATFLFTDFFRTVFLSLLFPKTFFIFYARISIVMSVAVKVLTVSRCKRMVADAVHGHWHSLRLLHNKHILDLLIIWAWGLIHATRCTKPFIKSPLFNSTFSHHRLHCPVKLDASLLLHVCLLWNHIHRLSIGHLRIRHQTLMNRFGGHSSWILW